MTSMPSSALKTDDGVRLFTRFWFPERPARGVVVLIHGYAEHSGRYEHVAQTLTRQNLQVCALDLRGHGQSEGPRAYVDDFDRYLDDLDLFLNWTSTPSDIPLFLFGHSMGGLIALKYTLDRTPSLRGLVLSAPAIEVNPNLAPLLRHVARLLGRVVPTLPTVRSPPGAISRDPDVVDNAKHDPLNYHGRVKARMGAELLRAGAEVRTRLDTLTVPFLVIHGTGDILARPKWSQRLYNQATSDDKTIQLYEGLYHETFNEPERDTVLRDLQEWIVSRLPDASTAYSTT